MWGRTVTIFLGGYQQETDYIDFDCGNGVEEHELAPATIDASTGSWKDGTSITCNVTEEGLVRIWGDAANIAVIRFDGCYITDLKMQEMPPISTISTLTTTSCTSSTSPNSLRSQPFP